MHAKRIAAIDIGTVTCRLLVADVEGRQLVELERRCVITNLGVGVDQTHVLRADAIERVVAQVADYVSVVDSYRDQAHPSIPIVAVATSASRDAKNASALIERLRNVGVELSVIPGEREAALSFRGASRGYEGEPLVVVDIGGGSTETVFGQGGEAPRFAHSFNIGCRRVTERFLASDPPAACELDEARSWVRAAFAPIFAEARKAGCEVGRVVAVAGTATSVVSVNEQMKVYDPVRVDGTVVTREVLAAIYARLAALPVAARAQVIGLEPKRAPVIVAGMAILLEVLDALGAESFTVSESDILQGLILGAADA